MGAHPYDDPWYEVVAYCKDGAVGQKLVTTSMSAAMELVRVRKGKYQKIQVFETWLQRGTSDFIRNPPTPVYQWPS